MDEMTIHGTAIAIKEYQGKRVVTFKDIDTIHQRPDGTARKRFNDNRRHLISGVDFFRLTIEEIQLSEIRTVDNLSHNGLTLITETGYLMLVKSFTDDLAWTVQRELVDTYFRAKEIIQQVQEADFSIDTGKLIQCAEIMAGCLDGNRMYVLNILRNIIPNIDTLGTQSVTVSKNGVEVPDTSERILVKSHSNGGYSTPFNRNLLRSILSERNMTYGQIERLGGFSSGLVSRWVSGSVTPCINSRITLCTVLGLPEDYFNNNRRVRNILR